jgi:general secretion pathway protein G
MMTNLIPMRHSGFTLAETLLTMALLAITAGAAVPNVSTHLEQTRATHAAEDIRRIETALKDYREQHHELPDSLEQLPLAVPLDPWGRPYEYVNFATRGLSEQRYFHNLPLNSDYDLYSRGADGRTDIPLNAASAADDVVRGRDGEFVGLAAEF